MTLSFLPSVNAVNDVNLDLWDCRSTLSTIPIALIKISSEVEPALMKGNGKPVGGIEPLNISYCIINLNVFCD